MRTELQASSQSCRSVDADAWYKRGLKGPFTPCVSDASAISLLVKCNIVVHLCNDAPEWVRKPFSSVSIDFNESRIASVIAELSLTLGVNGAL